VSVPIRVMIVDDHPVVRNGLIGMFEGDDEFEIVGEAGDGAEAVRRAGALLPDVILMDLRMPTMDGVAAMRAGGRRIARAGARTHHLRHRLRRALSD
jgi:DNA-binding NarL/FixJ family response regulator